ncbi:MAG TPA: hypothetical protein VJG67_03635 [Candidatus Paceibacterota bacterium]
MKKKMKIPIHTTLTEPEDYTPFSMVFGSVWKAYDAGELNPDKLLLFNFLYRKVNPYNGIGLISYTELCVQFRRRTSKQNINAINKLMMELRDIHQLIWFPPHSGSREFPYVIAKFKFAPLDKKRDDKWIDIDPYFQSKDRSVSRAFERAVPKSSPEPMPRHQPPEQRLERSNDGGFTQVNKNPLDRYQTFPDE